MRLAEALNAAVALPISGAIEAHLDAHTQKSFSGQIPELRACHMGALQ
jgi:hypothetical protein